MIEPGKVAFDFDGVIADTMQLFVDIARQEHGVNSLSVDDMTCYSLEKCLNIDPQIIPRIIGRIMDGGYRAPLNPLDGAPEVLRRIGRAAQPLLLVTARPYPGPMAAWVRQNIALPANDVCMVATGSFEGKAEVLAAHNIAYFVEDRLETCFALAEQGIVPILFKQPWNRQKHPFQEVDSWKAFEALIQYP